MASRKSRSRSDSPDRHRETSPSRSSRSPPPQTIDGNGKEDPSRKVGRKSGKGGFKWKEKKPDAKEDPGGGGKEKRLERGYRVRKEESKQGRTSTEDKLGTTSKFGLRARERDRNTPSEPSATLTSSTQADDTSKPPERAPRQTVQPTGEPLIIVHINDRLGTKAAIPCLASDPIKLFKAQVAARIGRQPREIMLKRQGERPFKDQLSLEDYGVSNGVQIDLEIDTGGD